MPPTRIERGHAMRRDGLTDLEIAERLGVTRQRVHALLGPRPAEPARRIDPPAVVAPGQLAARLRGWRARHGMTQAEAAAALRVPLKTFHNWEYGRGCALAELVAMTVDLLESRA